MTQTYGWRSMLPFIGFVLIAPVTACGNDATVRPTVLNTFGYSTGEQQTVGCCTSREAQRAEGSSEYAVEGTNWFDEQGSFHEGKGLIDCLKKDKRTPVQIGYLVTSVTKEAPGGPVVVWVRCPLSARQ